MTKLSLFGLILATNLFAEELKTIDNFRAAAAKSNVVLSVPDWEQTPEAITASSKRAIAKANAALGQIAAQDLDKVTFDSTIGALEDLRSEASIVANRAALMGETNPDPAVRAAAENSVKTFQEWNIGFEHREDVYKAIKAFADTNPNLSGEDEKLLKETLRDYRRDGMELSPEPRKEVERWRRDLSKLAADFETNIATAAAPVVFKRAELDGLPDDFFSWPGIKIDNDSYQVLANVPVFRERVVSPTRRARHRSGCCIWICFHTKERPTAAANPNS